MKQKKLIFNFFVNRNWKKLTDSRKIAKILADNRKRHHPIETLLKEFNGELQTDHKGQPLWRETSGTEPSFPGLKEAFYGLSFRFYVNVNVNVAIDRTNIHVLFT